MTNCHTTVINQTATAAACYSVTIAAAAASEPRPYNYTAGCVIGDRSHSTDFLESPVYIYINPRNYNTNMHCGLTGLLRFEDAGAQNQALVGWGEHLLVLPPIPLELSDTPYTPPPASSVH